MWISRLEVRRILEQVKAADARAKAAESALAVERRERMNDVRHVISQFLRREKTFPLPRTAEEKAEAKVEAEEKKNQPVPLTETQIAMRDANRREAARFGKTEEEADKDFEERILNRMME